MDGIGVCIGQPFHPIGRDGLAKHDEASFPQLGDGVNGELAPDSQCTEPIRHLK